MFVASPTRAADLGARPSQIGAIFAEPRPRSAAAKIYQRPERDVVGAALKVPGYYGQPTDFEYHNYYGTSPIAIYSRLPYACGFVGAC